MTPSVSRLFQGRTYGRSGGAADWSGRSRAQQALEMRDYALGGVVDQRTQAGNIADAGGGGERAAEAVAQHGLVERGADGETEHAEQAVPEAAGGDELFGRGGRKRAGGGQAAQRLGRVLMEDGGMGGGVAQLQELGDELDVEHAAAAVLDVPELVARILLGDARAHVQHLGGEPGRIARAHEDLPQHGLEPSGEGGRAGDDAGAGERHMLPGPGALELVAAEAFDAGSDGAL